MSDVESYERELIQIRALEDVKTVEAGEFVLVKFATKSSVAHYVGCVIKKEQNEYEIKFLRRQRSTWKFVYLPLEDLSTVMEHDIVFKLPFPKNVGGTERSKSTLSFGVDFSYYNNLR